MTEWEHSLERVEYAYRQLVDADPTGLDVRPSSVPMAGGVYLISEGDTPLYVGRTRNLQRRLRDHLSTSVIKAALAVRIARTEADLPANHKPERSALQLYRTSDRFRAEFDDARRRIGTMQARYVLVEDDVDQTLLEICAAVELNTPYNSFRTT